MVFYKKKLCSKLKHCLKVQLAFIITISVCLFGCGIKGPPVPPRQAVVPAVKDLSSIIEGDMIFLSWTVPDKPEDKNILIKGFVVHRAKQKISEGDCKNCPVKFKPVAEVPAETKPGLEKMKYSEPIEKGFKYIFKVKATSDTGAESRDSNSVEVIY
jgi:predicted small lipoprotein YifL